MNGISTNNFGHHQKSIVEVEDIIFERSRCLEKFSRVYCYQHIDFPKKEQRVYICQEGPQKRTENVVQPTINVRVRIGSFPGFTIYHPTWSTRYNLSELMSSSNIKHLSFTQFLNIILSKPFFTVWHLPPSNISFAPLKPHVRSTHVHPSKIPRQCLIFGGRSLSDAESFEECRGISITKPLVVAEDDVAQITWTFSFWEMRMAGSHNEFCF